jgi:peroxiredoxin
MRWRALLVLGALALGAVVLPPEAAAEVPRAPLPAPGWLGVGMDAGGLDGITVKHVIRSSPANKAGLKEGDRIVKLDGRVVSRASEVTRAVGERAAGEVLVVRVARAGNEIDLKVTIEPRPSDDEMLRMDHVGSFAPAWANVAPVGGAPKTLAQLRGRVVVVDFWATWCGPCRQVAPRLSALQARFGAQGLTVVGITTDEPELAAAFAAKTDMKYGIVVDAQGETSRAYGVRGLPTMFVVDKRGVIREVQVGFDPTGSGDAALEQLLKVLLAEPAPK